MTYAVIATGGKQYKVSEGTVIEVEKLAVDAGKDFTFEKVLLYAADGNVTVGQPSLSHITITGKILEQAKGRKIYVSKFKAKARYRKTIGHRQHLTRVQIGPIVAKESKAPAKKEKTA